MPVEKKIGGLIMKLHTFPTLMFIVGIIIIIGSVYRWFFFSYILSKLCFGVGLGGAFIVMGYLYNWMKEVDLWRGEMFQRVENLGAYVTGNALEAVEENVYVKGGNK